MTAMDALQPTWPPKSTRRLGPFTLRDGAGGGKRVSATTLDEAVWTSADLDCVEDAMRAAGQRPLFSVAPDQDDLDVALSARGYAKIDPTLLYDIAVDKLTRIQVPPTTAFAIWEPLAIMEDIWAAGGIGPARRAVMARVTGPKTGLLGRINQRPAAAAFVAIHGPVAMLHALEVAAEHRRQGMARWMMIAAAHWAQTQGADTLALLVTQDNGPANALYQSLGFAGGAGYHYRIAPEA